MDTEAAIAVLTAMITPAVLISACGSMILSTSSRLGRVVDRVRSLSDRLEEMAELANRDPLPPRQPGAGGKKGKKAAKSE